MKKLCIFFCLIFPLTKTFAQTEVKGTIIDRKGEAIVGANVFLKNTYDGVSSDSTGFFSFSTNEKEQDTLVITFLGFEKVEKKIQLNVHQQNLKFTLKEEANELNTVVITAGFFEASDSKKMVMLRPLDIVTTAGAGADIFNAIQTLPGTARVGETEGLFVRGGSAAESKTIIDGQIVQNPFFSSLPDISQRGRFNPFLFKGTAFSTGGYSAQYGQALSSVLALNSQDLPENSNLNLFVSLLTGGITATKRWENTSFALSGNYTNLGLAFKLIPQNVDWVKPPEAFGNGFIFRHKPTENSLFKAFGNYGHSNLKMDFRNFDGQITAYQLINDNLYYNSFYQNSFGKWTATGGFSYSYNEDNIHLNTDKVLRKDSRTQGRAVFVREIAKKSSFLLGTEVHHYQFESGFNQFLSAFDELYSAAFAETEIYLSRRLAGRIGLRGEYSRLLQQLNVAPRFSMAYQTGEGSQVSFAFGQFYQNPENKYLFQNTDLNFEKASHYIANYQIIKNNRTFRIEAYYKDYQNLIKELDLITFDANPNRIPTSNLDNSGYGYARGFDIFWRDTRRTLKNSDYWISYSFLDTKRLYQNFPLEAVPGFASRHNLSVVYKQFVRKISTNLGFTYSFATGRPYYNPNTDNFMSDLSPAFHNLGINVNHLTNILGNFTVFIFSVDNVLGIENVFGYRYSADGSQKYAVNPASYRSFFLGMSMTIN